MTKSPSNALVRILARLGGHELGVLLAIAGVAAGFWIFVAIAGEVTEGDTQALDRKLLLAMRHPGDLLPLGPPAFQEAARDITALGGPTVLAIITLITGTFLLLDGKKHMALLLYASVGSGLLLSTVLKDLFARPRPDLVPYATNFSSGSFPSGHSMLSAVTYLTLGALLARSQERRRLKEYFLVTAVLLSFLVGVSRVYLGVHWPTDVLAGWTAGASWAALCWIVARHLQRRQTIEPET
jgi:undecaprenyl-diphosphatase